MNAKIVNIHQEKVKDVNFQVTKFPKRKLVVPLVNGIEVIAIDQIVYLKSSSNYTHVHLACGRMILVSKTLKRFEQVLKDKSFIRIHQSYIINIDSIECTENQRVKVKGIYLPISKEKKKILNTTIREAFIHL